MENKNNNENNIRTYFSVPHEDIEIKSMSEDRPIWYYQDIIMEEVWDNNGYHTQNWINNNNESNDIWGFDYIPNPHVLKCGIRIPYAEAEYYMSHRDEIYSEANQATSVTISLVEVENTEDGWIPVPMYPIRYSCSRSDVIMDTIAEIEEIEDDIHNRQWDIITKPNLERKIPDEMYRGCVSLTYADIPRGTAEIGCHAFEGCEALETIVIPSSVGIIKEDAFRGCTNLKKVIIPDNSVLTVVEEYAFYDCKSLEEITLPPILTYIGERAFYNCTNLKNIVLPNRMNEIGTYAFAFSGLQSLTVPKSVKWIGDNAFCNCESLREVKIPATTRVGKGAFAECWYMYRAN